MNLSSFWRHHFSIILVFTVFTVGFFFITPDIVTWWRIDGFKTPIRAEMGDQTHYLTHLHRLQVEGVSGSSMFTWEHRNEQSRLLFFEKIMKALPGFEQIPIIWWHIILKFFSSMAVFLGLYWLFRICSVERKLAFFLALMSVFFYGPYAMQGPAVSSWFLIFFLLGLALFVFTSVRHSHSFVVLISSIFFLFASGMHPVYALTAIGMGGLWWLSRIMRKRTDLRVWLYAFIWMGVALLLFWLLFKDFMGIFWDPSYVGDGYLERNGSLQIHFLQFPLLAAKFALVILACWIGYRKSKMFTDVISSRRWLLFLFFAIPPLLVNIQNVFTGFSFLGRHFIVVEEFIVLPVAAMILFGSRSEMFQNSRIQRVLGIIFLAIIIIFIASLTIDRPIQSWLVLGRWVPLLTGYIVIGGFLAFPRKLSLWKSKVTKILPVILIFSIAYAGVFLWRFYVYDAPVHREVQQYREVFNRLSFLPAGVVMASPDISELVALYTPHRVYWSRMNGQFGGTYEELSNRLLDERLIFEQDSRLGGDFGRFSVFGAPNQYCKTLTEKYLYKPLREWSIANATLCNTKRIDRDWPIYLAEHSKKSQEILRGGEWIPRFRLDWLVVEEGKDIISQEIVGRYFKKIESVGNFTVYRYRFSNI